MTDGTRRERRTEAERSDALTRFGDVEGGTALARAMMKRLGMGLLDGGRWRRAVAYAVNAATGGGGRRETDADVVTVNAWRATRGIGGQGIPAVVSVGGLALLANALARLVADAVGDVAVGADALATAAFVAAFCPAVETIWMERDAVMGANALGIARVCADSARLRRVRFEFSADAATTTSRASKARDGADAEALSSMIPCFTLRKPLARGEERRLNLWEPRWLALMDALAERNGGSLVGAELGCLLGRHRNYCMSDFIDAIAGEDVDETSTKERTPDASRRTATVLVEETLRRARVVRALEGERPVSRARKLEVWIEGLDERDVDDVVAHPAGYLLAATTAATSDKIAAPVERRVDCVVVTGLAHVNGIVAHIAQA